MLDRVLGAALLEPETYEEAATGETVWGESLRGQALTIVLVTSLAAGIGVMGAGLNGLVAGTLAGLLGWALCAIGSFWMATKKYEVPRTAGVWGATWRGLALASTPRLFLVFTVIPGIGFLVGLAVHSWVLITSFFALRSSLDLDVRAATVTALSGWVPMLLVWAIVFLLAL
jgi:hypothetical protein